MGFWFLIQALTESRRKRRRIRRTTIAKEFPSEEQRDWSELPQEMLDLILKKLPDLLDFVRFRAVCQQWLSAASISDSPPQLPWYIIRDFGFSYPISHGDNLLLCSPHSGEVCKFNLNQWEGKRFIGSWHTYMLVFDENNSCLSLINPITRREITLPPINIDARWGDLLCISGEYIAIEGWNGDTLGFCRIGDENWKTVRVDKAYSICTYYNGLFFIQTSENGATEVIDAITGSLQFVIPPPKHENAAFENDPWDVEFEHQYDPWDVDFEHQYDQWDSDFEPEYDSWDFDFFVESREKLLGIRLIEGENFLNLDPSECFFEIYEFDHRNGNPQWVRTKNIGDQLLFLTDSFGLSLKASDYPEFRQNFIYHITFWKPKSDETLHLVKFDIEKGQIEEEQFPAPVDFAGFFLPSLH